MPARGQPPAQRTRRCRPSNYRSTNDITFINNYCETRGTTAVISDNVQNMTITNDQVTPLDHAWALQNHSTGATISGNRIAPGTQYEVGEGDSSQDGYNGFPPVGGPRKH